MRKRIRRFSILTAIAVIMSIMLSLPCYAQSSDSTVSTRSTNIASANCSITASGNTISASGYVQCNSNVTRVEMILCVEKAQWWWWNSDTCWCALSNSTYASKSGTISNCSGTYRVLMEITTYVGTSSTVETIYGNTISI